MGFIEQTGIPNYLTANLQTNLIQYPPQPWQVGNDNVLWVLGKLASTYFLHILFGGISAFYYLFLIEIVFFERTGNLGGERLTCRMGLGWIQTQAAAVRPQPTW